MKNKKEEEYNWFGSGPKTKKMKPVSFLGGTSLKPKIVKKIDFLGKPTKHKMNPSPLFKKEKINQKKRLSKWGDADLDGSPNYFDCDPTNWMKDADNPVLGNKEDPKVRVNIFERASKYAKNLKPKMRGVFPDYAAEKDTLKRRAILESEKASQKDVSARVDAKVTEMGERIAKGEIIPAEQKKALAGEVKSRAKIQKGFSKREGAEKMFADIKGAFELGGPLGTRRAKEIAIQSRLDAGKQATQKQIAALVQAEKKTAFFGKEGRLRRLSKAIPGVAQGEGVLGVVSGYGLGPSGHYTKEMRAKSARVRRLTQVAAGQVFGAGLTSIPASSEPRGRGRPAGPSGEYKIGGKPVYEEDFRQYEIKQRSLNSMLPSQAQSQTLNPEYVAQQKALEVERFKQDQLRAQMIQEQPLENMRDFETGDQTINEPVPSDQAPQTEGMTNEQVQAIEEARRRPYVRSSMDEIRQAQQMAQQRDQILNAPNFMKGELKAAGGSILTATGPQIMDAPNVFKGEMRNVNQSEDMPSIRLSERPQTNPYGDEYLEIELGSGKPVVRKRISEKWMTGEAL